MRRVHRYRVTHLSHVDYGAGAVDRIAHMTAIPDGTAWTRKSPSLALTIDDGELVHGDVVRFTLEKETNR